MAIIPMMATISHPIKHFVLSSNLSKTCIIIPATSPSSHSLVRFTGNHKPILDFNRIVDCRDLLKGIVLLMHIYNLQSKQ